eukprot:1444179-Pyramimonas_sp.AAC.1
MSPDARVLWNCEIHCANLQGIGIAGAYTGVQIWNYTGRHLARLGRKRDECETERREGEEAEEEKERNENRGRLPLRIA